MKKFFLIIWMICFIGVCAACGKESAQPTSVPETAEDNTSERETVEIDDKEELQEDTSSENEEVVQLPQILSLQESRNARYEGINDFEKLLLISEFNNVTFWEGADKYPEMNRTLSEIEGMQTRTLEEEADNMLSFATEMGMLDGDAENFETQISSLDVQVRRADSIVLSYLTDSYADYGFIEDFRGLQGSNYDVQTGKELLLADVITDMETIPAAVLKELNSHLWAGEGYSENVVGDYFKNTPEDGISWTLDYNGVTFYFGDGDLEEPGNGCLSATVSFAEYPELFHEKYTNVPESYMVELPLDHSFFTDLDGDGTLEELNCSGVYNKTDRFYSQLGIYTDSEGSFHYEDLFAYGFQPYYVKTTDGNHYIYLFCEESESGNRQMMLVVYNVNGGALTRIGDMNIAPAYISSDHFVLPLNPNHMLLDNYDSQAQDSEYYMVGADGMPVPEENSIQEGSAEYYDVEPDPENAMDIESLDPVEAKDPLLEQIPDTYYAYMMVNPQSGETVYYPKFTLQLSEDGTGYFETEDDYLEVLWYVETDGTITLKGKELYYYLTPYKDDSLGFEKLWFSMHMNERLLWIY
ncbi:MAG: hypothetical protein IJ429_03400 [Lachnospiraceae bacterium]|nr:hypothetical protein [Lachnospiraceae bacterium]